VWQIMKWAIEEVFAGRSNVGGAEFRKAILGLAAQAPVQNYTLSGRLTLLYTLMRACVIRRDQHPSSFITESLSPCDMLEALNLVC
jgi:hypothetical protein